MLKVFFLTNVLPLLQEWGTEVATLLIAALVRKLERGKLIQKVHVLEDELHEKDTLRRK